MKIAIITEANASIGYGHLYRSIALAQEFISNNFEIDFFCDGKSTIEIIQKHIPKTNIYQTSELNLIIQEYNLLIIDVYKSSWYTYEWLTQISDLKTVSIIDYTFKEYSIATDFIFQIGFQDHNFKEKITQNEIGKISKIYSGNDFFIFRNEFKNIHAIKIRKEAKAVLVSMGGSDPFKLTELVSKSIELISKPLEVNYILGAGFNSDRLKNLDILHKNSIHKINFYHNISNIPKVMLYNDIAIINGGNTRFELAILGIPFLSISINEKQNNISNSIQERGIGLNIGLYNQLTKEKLNRIIVLFLSNYGCRQKISNAMKSKIKFSENKIIELLDNELHLSKNH
ncbi:MAG: hypothetical protein ACOCUV_03765 [bacterium]